ncbi:MAG: hypothetical protein ACTSPB_13700 [Candidatus Thorarchaeota archaeon]
MTSELYKVTIRHERLSITDGTEEWLLYEDSCNTVAPNSVAAIIDVTTLWKRILYERGAQARNIEQRAEVITKDVISEWTPLVQIVEQQHEKYI